MRFFCYSYSDPENFSTSRKRGVLGCKEGSDASYVKFMQLEVGDVVVIRDSRQGENLVLFGCFIVLAPPFDQRMLDHHKIPRLLWQDEIDYCQMLYPYRVTVKYLDPLNQSSLKILWNKLLAINLINKKGKLFDKKGLCLFFKGNFLEANERFTKEQVEQFAIIMGVESVYNAEALEN